MIEDAELLRRYATDRSEDAFAELVRRHLAMVYGAALRRVNLNAALAEEVTQGVFTNLAREVETIGRRWRSGSTLSGWLYVATRHVAANAMRSEARRVQREQEAFAMHEIEAGGGDVAAGASDAQVWAQVRPELEAVMDELGEADRDAVLLRFFEGKAFGEIGASLRVSEDAARVRVNRALEKLRGSLAKRGITSTAAALGGLLAGNAAVAAPVGLAVSVMGAALAGGGVAVTTLGVSVGAAGFWTFMSTTKMGMGVLSVIAAVAVGTAVYEHREAKEAREEVVTRGREKNVVLDRVNELEAAKRTAEGKLQTEIARRERAEKVAADLNASTTRARTTEKAEPSMMEKMNALYGDPGFVEATLAKFRAGLPFTYGPLYRKLGLSPDQIAEFEKAITTQEEARIDVLAAGRTEGWAVNDPRFRNVNVAEQIAVSEKIRGILGESGFNEYKTFFKLPDAWGELSPLISHSFFSGTPLNTKEADGLARVVSAHRKSRDVDGVKFYSGYDWDRILEEGGNSLAPAQASLLRAYVEKKKADEAVAGYWSRPSTKGSEILGSAERAPAAK